MARNPRKKGPHSVTTSKSATSKEHKKMDGEINAFFTKVHRAIQDAKAKMTDAEREAADRGAEAILKDANAKPKPSRHTA